MKVRRIIVPVAALLICAVLVWTVCDRIAKDNDSDRTLKSQSAEEQKATAEKEKSSSADPSGEEPADPAGGTSASDSEAQEMIISPDGNVIRAGEAAEDNTGNPAGSTSENTAGNQMGNTADGSQQPGQSSDSEAIELPLVPAD